MSWGIKYFFVYHACIHACTYVKCNKIRSFLPLLLLLQVDILFRHSSSRGCLGMLLLG